MVIEKVGILGGGTMGMGICQALAQQGVNIVVCDVSDDILKVSLSQMISNLKRLVQSQRMTEDDAKAVESRIGITRSMGSTACDTNQ